jgi:hypothetical protein
MRRKEKGQEPPNVREGRLKGLAGAQVRWATRLVVWRPVRGQAVLRAH